MKRIVIAVFALMFNVFIFANDFMQPAQTAIDDQHQVTRAGNRTGHREQDPPPEYSFILNGNGDPTTFLIHSYFDYMPFSLNGYNVRLQPEISMPYGYEAGGIYITYMRSETPNVGYDRFAYYSYLNEEGISFCSESINLNPTAREGYTSCAIDPYTGDPFAVWHAITEPDGSYDTHMSYFLFHAGAQHWRQPFIVIDNPEMSLPFTGHSDDEYIWPQVHIGSSPFDGHRRVHVYGNNFANNSAGNANYNSLYLFADFDDTDLLSTSDLDWTIKSFPYFDDLHYNDIARINKDMIVSETDGKVIFFGNVADSLFALYSEDYGETFTKYTHQLLQQLPNLINIHTGQPMFGDEDWFALPTNDLTHYNGIFTDENTKIQWMSGVNYNSQENINNGFYMAYYIYPKIFTFDTETGEFSFYDLDIQDTDPGDDHLAVAYDLNNDGETWSDIRYINANPNDAIIDTTYHYDGNYAPEFEGMLPVNVTLGDKLEIISNEPGNYHAKLHFAFYDDILYGSQAGNNGPPILGGDLHYAAIDLEFQEEWIDPVSINDETIPQMDVQLYNYPNPFNPTTTISFNLPTEITNDTELSIYNIKGQKIRQFSIFNNESSIVWDGKDSNSKQVSSGIYFYKLKVNNKTEAMRKCLLLK